MAQQRETQRTGAEAIVWDLSDLYASIDDPQIEQDIEQLNTRVSAFATAHRGKIASYDEEELLEAIQEYEAITEGATRIGAFVNLLWTTDTGNAKYGAQLQRVGMCQGSATTLLKRLRKIRQAGRVNPHRSRRSPNEWFPTHKPLRMLGIGSG